MATDPALDKSAFGYTVADITRLFRRVFDRRAAHLDLTRAQWRALSRIQRAQGLTQAELAEDLEMEPMAVGRVVDRLVQAGFVERRADPADRRCWRLHLTARSDDVMGKMKRIAATLRDEATADVSDEDFERVMRLLVAVKNNLAELDREDRARQQARRKTQP
ncbi:MarR family winged helix-turn-helix transcriptional regulator [Arenimonas sp.]|uniref:MarR family winged helix-turn-helix transcriptional regulator n=1 Tax=Arenimonas sp. TaxID=1872635 RepID=UPI0039E2C697